MDDNRLNAMVDEVGDAMNDDARLAGTGAGENKQRSLEMLHSFSLGGVELVQSGNGHKRFPPRAGVDG